MKSLYTTGINITIHNKKIEVRESKINTEATNKILKIKISEKSWGNTICYIHSSNHGCS